MATLRTYHRKRKFGVTAEPRGKVGPKRGHAYVIQKHAARRLHYDLRLELDGVMKSWAVTRGPSLVPGEKRLAVEVEDHPIDYNTFEGTIPQGQYGGGTVMIWDRGSWQPEADPHKGLAKGHLAFTLDGEKLHGGWHLVRMHRKRGEKRNNWLLIKQHDEAAREAGDRDILEQETRSVTTGRTMDEITAGKARHRTASAKNSTAKKTAPRRRATAARPSGRKKRNGRVKPAKKTRKAESPLPDFIAPALATLSDKAPSSDKWVHEIKFDGYRIQAWLDHGKVRLLTRRGLNWTAKFQAIADRIATLPADTALIDGELVVETDQGLSSFSLLQQELSAGRDDRMIYYLFDLLHLDGEDLRDEPLTTRKQTLAALLKGHPKNGILRFSESLDDDGPTLHKHACQLGLEGIISKQRDAPYRSGRGHDWIKTKCGNRQEFVIAGFVPSTVDKSAIGALVLGVHIGGTLTYAGRTGTGFTHKSARELFRKLNALRTPICLFAKVPAEERGRRGGVWVEPKLVAEVDFHGWTHEGRVRQASFQGLREDKPAGEIVREVKVRTGDMASDMANDMANDNPSGRAKHTKPAKAAPTSARRTKGKQDVVVGNVHLTHPDRVYWPEAGITKRDLATFYETVWDHMRPHVINRPVSLLRCPDGAAGQCFFQKHISAGIDASFVREVREPDGDKIFVIDDLDGLIALAQGGALEIHLRGSSAGRLEDADRLIFDLDPGPGVGWSDIVAAAREVRERLDTLKLDSFLKTSGGKGLHVVLPIKPTPWEEAKIFTRGIAEAMAADSPNKFIDSATKSQRKGKIFVDYLRNSREATAVAPYSTRARPAAGVATPIDWSELGKLKSADQYTVLNLERRLSRLRRDPWADLTKVKQALPKGTGRKKRH